MVTLVVTSGDTLTISGVNTCMLDECFGMNES